MGGLGFKLLPATSVVCPSLSRLGLVEVKEELRGGLKVHPRETYDDVIRRLIEVYRKCQQ